MSSIQSHARAPFGALPALSATAIAVATLLTACGGGDADMSVPDVGSVSIDLTDGPASHLDKVWVTIKEVWFHRSDSATTGEGKWEKFPLAAPVTVDMNTLSNGTLAKAFSGIQLPVGTYKQIRLFLAGSEDPLTASAKAAGLAYNDQINYTDAKGAKQVAALEIASAANGIGLNGVFEIAKGKTLRLAVEFNVGDDVVRFSHNSADAFKLQPNLRYFDLDSAAAISGKIDMSACGSLATPCREIAVKLEEPAADGAYNRIARWTAVKPDGTFMLYPVPASKGKTYDLVITGRNTQPMLVRGVPATAGSTPAKGAVSVAATALQIKPANDFPVNIKPGVTPTGSRVGFYATPTAADKPYEFGFSHLNGFTGTMTRDYRMANGPLLVGAYLAGGSPNFSAVAPAEGSGAYSAVFSANNFKRAAAAAAVAASGTSTSFVTPPTMLPLATVAQLGTITGNLIQSKAGAWDRGLLVVSHRGAIVNAITLDTVLSANGGSGGAYAITSLPSGSKANPLAGGAYDVYLRIWNSKTPDKVKTIQLKDLADLRSASAATMNVTLP